MLEKHRAERELERLNNMHAVRLTYRAIAPNGAVGQWQRMYFAQREFATAYNMAARTVGALARARQADEDTAVIRRCSVKEIPPERRRAIYERLCSGINVVPEEIDTAPATAGVIWGEEIA